MWWSIPDILAGLPDVATNWQSIALLRLRHTLNKNRCGWTRRCELLIASGIAHSDCSVTLHQKSVPTSECPVPNPGVWGDKSLQQVGFVADNTAIESGVLVESWVRLPHHPSGAANHESDTIAVPLCRSATQTKNSSIDQTPVGLAETSALHLADSTGQNQTSDKHSTHAPHSEFPDPHTSAIAQLAP